MSSSAWDAVAFKPAGWDPGSHRRICELRPLPQRSANAPCLRPGLLLLLGVVALLAGPAARLAAADPAGAPPAGGNVEPPRSPVELRDRPILGSATAGIVVVEVSSFKCTHCRAFHEKILPTLREQYIDPGKVQWVVLNASDDSADQFSKIFALARCAFRQGKYWEMLDSLFAVAHRAPSFLEDLIARSPHIDRTELDICLRDRTLRNTIAGDFADYARLKVRGTPTFLIRKLSRNGQQTETTIAGAQTLEYFQRVLDEMLKVP